MPITKITNNRISDTSFKDLNKKEIIDIRVEKNAIQKRIFESKRPCNCLLCKKNTSLINSHTIPRTFIDNIAINGKVLNFNWFIKDVTKKEETGINNSNTFRMVCSECDSKYFNEYENEDVYSDDFLPSQLFMRKIALKSYLRILSTKYDDFFSNEELKNYSMAYGQYKRLFENDIKDYKNLINKLKNEVSKSDDSTRFTIIYSKKLSYVIPCAFQGLMGLVTGFNGEVINNLYLINKKHTTNIYICAFPLKQSSQIIVFRDMYNSNYKQFENTFEKLSEEEKLTVINEIILMYSNDLIISPKLENVVLNAETIELADKMTHAKIEGEGPLPSKFEKTMALLQHSLISFKLNLDKSIYNFLLEYNS